MHHLPAREQFSDWCELICEAFATPSPDTASRNGFGSAPRFVQPCMRVGRATPPGAARRGFLRRPRKP
jgi:hypothetical protein